MYVISCTPAIDVRLSNSLPNILTRNLPISHRERTLSRFAQALYNVAMPFTILIVDDEIEVCLSLAEVLSSKGYRTLHVDSPLDVLTLLEHEKIDLAIMDVRMPAMGGWTSCGSFDGSTSCFPSS